MAWAMARDMRARWRAPRYRGPGAEFTIAPQTDQAQRVTACSQGVDVNQQLLLRRPPRRVAYLPAWSSGANVKARSCLNPAIAPRGTRIIAYVLNNAAGIAYW